MTFKAAKRLRETFTLDNDYNIVLGEAILDEPFAKGYVYANFFFYDEVQKEVDKLEDLVKKIHAEVVGELGVAPDDVMKLFFEISTRATRTLGDDGLDSVIKEFLAERKHHISLLIDQRERNKFDQICEAIFSEITAAFYQNTLLAATDLEKGIKTFKFTREYAQSLTDQQKIFIAPALRIIALANQISLRSLQISDTWTVKYQAEVSHTPFVKQEESIKDQIKEFITKNQQTVKKTTAALPSYSVTWMDADNIIYKADSVEKGNMPEPPPTPQKTSDDWIFTFQGWTNDSGKTVHTDLFPPIHNDTIYTAIFDQQKIYLVAFMDGETTLQYEQVREGHTTNFKEATPQHPADEKYSYEFVGWAYEPQQFWTPTTGEPECFDVELALGATDTTGEINEQRVYFAVYTRQIRTYVLTFKNHEGNDIYQPTPYEYGTQPAIDNQTREGNADVRYEFIGWSPYAIDFKKSPTLVPVGTALPLLIADTTYHAIFAAQSTGLSKEGKEIFNFEKAIFADYEVAQERLGNAILWQNAIKDDPTQIEIARQALAEAIFHIRDVEDKYQQLEQMRAAERLAKQKRKKRMIIIAAAIAVAAIAAIIIINVI